MLDGLKTLDLKELLAVSGEKLGKDVSTEALAKVNYLCVEREVCMCLFIHRHRHTYIHIYKHKHTLQVAVSTVDAVLAQLPNGGSYLRDMVQLEKGAGSMKEADRVLIKARGVGVLRCVHIIYVCVCRYVYMCWFGGWVVSPAREGERPLIKARVIM